MRKEKMLGFFQKEVGRKLVFYAAGATTIGLFVGNFVPHTFAQSYYRNFVTSYENGVPRPVPEKVRERLEQALETLELRPYERIIIRPFTVFGFDLFAAGSTKYRYGCALGIPANYAYSSRADIKRSEIRFRTEEIDWSSESGQLLQEAIVLSEDEKLFGLCKSVLQLRSHRVLMNSIFPSVSFLTVYSLGHYLNQRLGLLTRPLGMRLVMYGILGLFGLGSWTFMKDYNQVTYDAQIDKTLSALGPEFVEAGMRYYDKLLKKNIALRALIGDDTYTAKGNENYFIRQKSLPLTIRKSFFEQKFKELREAAETSRGEVGNDQMAQ